MSSIQDFLCIFRFTKEEKENATLLLSSDESMAFVAVPNAIGGEGAVCVFTRIGSLWSHSQTLTAEGGESGGHFGKQLYLNEYGVLVVSSENKTVVSGTPYRFKNNGETWKLCTPISIGVQAKEKDINKQVRAAELMAVSIRCRSLGLPPGLWLRLNNKLVDIADAGVKASGETCGSQSKTISVHQMLILRRMLFKLWCDGFLNEVQFEELIGIAARYTKDAVSKTQKKAQQSPVETASTQLVNKAKQAKLDHNKKWDVFYDILEHRNTPPKLHALLYVKMLTMIGPPESARVPLFRENVEALFDSKALIKDIEKMVGDNLLHELSFKVFERQIMKYVSSTYPFSDNCKHDVQNHQGETSVKNEKDQASQHTTQGETMNDKPKQQDDIHALLSAAILNKSDQEVRTLFSTFCSSVVSKGMIDPNVANHLHNLFGTYTKVPKGSTFQPMNPQFQPFAPMQPRWSMGFQGLHPSQFQNPQAFRPNLPNQGIRYDAALALHRLESELHQTVMQLRHLEQAVENTKFHQTLLNAQCDSIRNILNSTPGK